MHVFKFDHFTIVESNADNVPDNASTTLFSHETQLLNSVFTSNTPLDTFPDYKNDFKKQSKSSPFYIIFKSFIQEAISSYFREIGNYKEVKVIRDVYNVYTRDDGENRHFVFNVDIINNKLAFTRKLKVYMILHNVERYLNDRGEVSEILDGIQGDLKLRIIRTDDPKSTFSYGSMPKDDSSPMRIANRTDYHDPMYNPNAEVNVLAPAPQVASSAGGETGFCFNASNFTNRTECMENEGIWDTMPSNNEDCPFYKLNTNYPNAFGGLIGYSCQLPRNSKLIGFKMYSTDPQYSPLCYNCKTNLVGTGTLGDCCKQQMDKTVYPSLSSPDYAYLQDTNIRKKYEKEFGDKGLKVE
ncbi:hypothetical protein EB118_11875 [bacterium]|nr:hypothetical protein [bacterium]NDD83657.1 hypothetical protein [bacterium]NDG30758.1 hypothetical protein [bacterium]